MPKEFKTEKTELGPDSEAVKGLKKTLEFLNVLIEDLKKRKEIISIEAFGDHVVFKIKGIDGTIIKDEYVPDQKNEGDWILASKTVEDPSLKKQ